jgi:hypothetical protein
MPANSPARDLSEAPDDWLQAYAILLDEDNASEDKFVRHIEAIYKLREIEDRDGHRGASFEEVKAELIRRGLRETDPEPEFMTRSATVAAIKERDGCKLHQARYLASLLPCFTKDGHKWLTGPQRYRIADVKEFPAGE